MTLHADGSCSIKDNGRGIPVDIHPKFKVPAIELVLTNLHAGRKIRAGRLQVFGRSAWRRREVRQCAFGLVQGGGIARRQGLPHGIRAGGDHAEAYGDWRSEEQEAHGHADHVLAGSRRSSTSRPSSSLRNLRRGCASWPFSIRDWRSTSPTSGPIRPNTSSIFTSLASRNSSGSSARTSSFCIRSRSCSKAGGG